MVAILQLRLLCIRSLCDDQGHSTTKKCININFFIFFGVLFILSAALKPSAALGRPSGALQNGRAHGVEARGVKDYTEV